MAELTRSRGDAARGLGVALAVLGAWAAGLVLLLSLPLGALPPAPVGPLLIGAGLAVQTFLYTGLFITAHDAMHGTLCPRAPRLNDALGALAVGLYALFSFSRLRAAHHRHHATPAQPGDPDSHDGQRTGLVAWYLAFMGRYLRPGQLVGMALVFNLLRHGLGLPLANVLLFWVAPALLSTVQLFVVGTWLPHRPRPGGHRDHHRAHTLDLPVWLSFFACYHFGYHHEHHLRPGVPWWRLPTAWRAARGR